MRMEWWEAQIEASQWGKLRVCTELSLLLSVFCPPSCRRLLSCLLNSGRACDLIWLMKSEQRWHPLVGRHF